ncbi:MAG: protease pro-enzyme activation domain-containing protein [Thermoplasmata archaeon]
MENMKGSFVTVILATLIAVLFLGGSAAALAPSAGATQSSAGIASLPAVSSGPTASWSVATLHAAPVAAVPDNELGIGVTGAASIGPAAVSTIPILVSLSFSHEAQLNQYLQALSDPNSALYHHYLTAAEFDAIFGGSASVYNSAVAYFTSFGVTGLVTYADHATISFDATPAQVEAIFHTSIEMYQAGSASFYAPTRLPTLAAPLASYISSVTGLSDVSKLLIHDDVSYAPPHAAVSAAATPVAAHSAALHSTPCTSNGGPFKCTTVAGLGYPEPLYFPTFCSSTGTGCTGQIEFGSDYQVAYNETNPTLGFSQSMFGKYGYPIGADIATILWSDPNENVSDPFCATQSTSAFSWDFYAPDVTSYVQYNLPKGEPMAHAFSVALAGPAPYASARHGLSAACDSGGASLENTLDMDMESLMAPGSNVYQVFGQGPSTVTLDTAFASILNPKASDGPSFSPSVIKGLDNVSVIANSWGYGVNYNDTNWYMDLEESQARGITVVASSGDSAATSTSSPASQAYSAFGDVAVGGTTLTLNPVTLQRSPLTVGSNPYTVCTGKQVCGSEIAWYEPLGTVAGFGETLGSEGGVARMFPTPSYQKDSSDVRGVLSHISEKGRGVPDIAAVANDTSITWTFAGYSYNVTCEAVTTCGGPPGFVTGYFTYVVGTSISDQVEGGIIATIDHTLWARHLPWLGFLNPQAYSLGQLQYDHALAIHPFFDVTQYRNKGDHARVGWDLVTGWGTMDGGNYSQLAIDLAIGSPVAAELSTVGSIIPVLAVVRSG